MSDQDNISTFDALIIGTDIPGDAGVALDTSGTSGFGGRGIATFAGVGDLDGDGRDDLAAGSLWALSRDGVTIGNFAVFSGLDDADPDGFVRPSPIFRTPGNDNSLEGYSFSSLGDFDGDGRLEILVGRDPRVNNEDGDRGGHVHHELDGGVIIGERLSSFGGSETDFIGDVNGDGFDDILLTSNDGTASHQIVLGNLDGSFDQRIDVDGFGGVSAYLNGHAVSGGADINGDGVDDFALINTAASGISLFNGSDILDTQVTLDIDDPANGALLTLPDRPLSVELLTDFNGDGFGDLLVSWRGGAAVVFGGQDLTGPISLASLGPDDGIFIDISNLNHVAYAAGDLNGDGLSDINFSDRLSNGTVETGVIFGHRDLTGDVGLADLDGGIGFRISDASAGQSIGDSNGDGFDDLLLRVGEGRDSFMAILHGAEDSVAPEPEQEPEPTPVPAPQPEPEPTPAPEPQPEPEPAPAPAPQPEPEPAPAPQPEPEPAPQPAPEPAPQPTPEPVPQPVPIPPPSPPADPPVSDDATNGPDFLFGTDGNDTISGLEGDDTIDGFDGADVVSGGDGRDRIRGGLDDGSDQLFGGGDDDILVGGNGDDTLSGEAGNDLLNAGDGADEVFGGLGDDFLKGGAGNDVMSGGDARDTVLGESGDDLIFGGGGRDVLKGGGGIDEINGGNGADRMHGGDGADTLDGGEGNDYIFGDAGADVFVFGPDSGVDRIADFDASEGDRLDFTALGIDAQSVAVNLLSGNLVLDVASIRVVLEDPASTEFDITEAGLF